MRVELAECRPAERGQQRQHQVPHFLGPEQSDDHLQLRQRFGPQAGLRLGVQADHRPGQVRVQVLAAQHEQGDIGPVRQQGRPRSGFLQGHAVRRVVREQLHAVQRARHDQPGFEQIAGVGVDDADAQGNGGGCQRLGVRGDPLHLGQADGCVPRRQIGPQLCEVGDAQQVVEFSFDLGHV